MLLNKERILIIGAFGAIYFIWGATFLVNWYAIQDIPPFLMAGTRFLVAGSILFIFGLAIGVPLPSRRNWYYGSYCGILFLSIGTGGVVWAEQFIDSNMAALLIGGEPLVIVLLMWQLKAVKPKWNALFGVFIGILGMYLLVGQPKFLADAKSLIALSVIGISMLAWGYVAVKINDFDLPESKLQSSAIQMIGGGLALLILSLFTGEYSSFNITGLSIRAVLSWIYLVFLGSIVAFSAFNYLLTKVSPDKVATSGYVNPVVAMLLGWGLNNEEITFQSLIAAVIILLGVFFINTKFKSRTKKQLKQAKSFK